MKFLQIFTKIYESEPVKIRSGKNTGADGSGYNPLRTNPVKNQIVWDRIRYRIISGFGITGSGLNQISDPIQSDF